MSTRHHNLFWLLPALLLLMQSLLPSAALADVSMRCAGMTAAMPCARMTVALTSPHATEAQMARMPCCRGQMPSCPMTPSAHSTLLSAHRCLLTIQAWQTAHTLLMPSSHRWLLGSVPALAPPARPLLHTAVPVPVTLRSCRLPIASKDISSGHGLRAPPCA